MFAKMRGLCLFTLISEFICLATKTALDGRFLHNKISTKIENKTSTILPALPKYFGSNWRVRGQSASTF
jgi:hypothetical protein